MKIRRYFGKDAQEAIQKVRAELGSDALILNTRKVKKKGLPGIFSKPVVEVLAAIDEYDTGNTVEREKAVPASVKKISELESKISNMQDMISKLYHHFGETTEKKPGEPKTRTDTSKHAVSYSQVLHRNLTSNDIDEYFARTIIDGLKGKMDEKRDVNECAVLLSNYISELLGSPETIRLRDDGKPTTVLFIGPTGVGKTTTLAKIAANYSLNYRKEVALITTDTYRIAAVEQLRTYADILGLPLSVVYSTGEIKDVIDEYSEKDLILIDTAGRSHSSKAQFEELKKWVNSTQADETYLVLSMTTGNASCREILKHYSFLKDYKLIFTKFDEAPTAGIILNVRMITGKKLSYITTGQNVPDDIEVVDIEEISKKLIGSMEI